MELSGMELRYLVNEIKKKVVNGYYVSNVYGITRDAIQLKLHHATEPDILLMISSKGIWLSSSKFNSIEQAPIVNNLRHEITRAKIDDIEQIGSERIVILKFSLENKVRNLIAEFFAGGNVILCDESMKILGILNPIEVRHRILKVGEKYTYPPRRGTDIFDLRLENMTQIRSSDLDVARWIGRNFAMPKKFVEEVILTSSIDINTKGKELTEKDITTLYNKITNLVSDVCNGKHQPILVMHDNVAVDASPIPLQRTESAVSANSYMEAVDTVFSSEVKNVSENLKTIEFDNKISDLERALEEQDKAREILIEKSKSIRGFADSLTNLTRSGFSSLADESVKEFIRKSGIILEQERGSQTLTIMSEKITIKNSKIPSVVSVMYNKVKELENGLRSIDLAKSRLTKELQNLKQQSDFARQEIKVKQLEIKEWYERYRWFFTTDGLLAVGGRDASSNSAIVRRHLTDRDMVFHADVHGSPFFLLKNANGDEVNSISEVAHATVSFSRAWKGGVATADAYWVRAEQVKKAAPSGQYLPKGSFVIEGKRNYVKGVQLQLAVGLVKINQAVKIMSGPPGPIRMNSFVYVLIVPNSSSASDTAKKIKTEFVKNLDSEFAEIVKDLSLDEIIRVLPSGGCKIIKVSVGDARHLTKD